MWSFWEQKLSRKEPLKIALHHSLLCPMLSRFCHRFSHHNPTADVSASRLIRWICWPYVCLDVWPVNPVCSSVRLYAVGGRDGSSCLRSVECFDPHTNKWSMCAPMSKRRGGVGVATYNNFLYAVGGHDAPASNHCSRLSDCVERWVSALSQKRGCTLEWFEYAVRRIQYRLSPLTALLLNQVCLNLSLQGRAHGCHRGEYVTVSSAICWLILESLE